MNIWHELQHVCKTVIVIYWVRRKQGYCIMLATILLEQIYQHNWHADVHKSVVCILLSWFHYHICSYPGHGYNSPTAHFVWLFWSPGHSFHTYIINSQKPAQDTYFLTFLFLWVTVSRVLVANIVRCPCSDSSHVTAPYKLSFYYYFLLLWKLWYIFLFSHQ